MNVQETWKPVAGYEGWYEISDKGRIKRIAVGRGATVGHIRQPTPDGGGYLWVRLSRNGRKTLHKSSHLVAAAFVGDLRAGQHVHHIDHNIKNNAAVNLRIMPEFSHRSYHQRGSANPNATLTEDDVRAIKLLRERLAWPQWKLGWAYNVGQSSISEILAGKTWVHVA